MNAFASNAPRALQLVQETFAIEAAALQQQLEAAQAKAASARAAAQ